ncbi:MAG: PdxA family protein [Lautropia sp.]
MAAALPRIAVTLGDPAGIGPEIALKTARDPRVRAVCRPLLVGDTRALRAHADACGLCVALRRFETSAEADTFTAIGGAAATDGNVEVAVLHQDSISEHFRIGEIDAANGRAAVRAVEAAVAAAHRGDVEAVVAAPIHELAIAHAGIAFDGHASYVARQMGLPPDAAYLMLCRAGIRIVHVTLHTSVRKAIEQITVQRVLDVLSATDRALRRLGVARPRIGVSGLNPHAGESGLFGDEEIEILRPAIEQARQLGIDAAGPEGADTLLVRSGYDAFAVMLHDQGHIAMKVAAPHHVIGVVVGIPLLFCSVGHGSAMDIAGRGVADAGALTAAVLALAAGHASSGHPYEWRRS